MQLSKYKENKIDLGHKRECLIIVNATSLCVALCNQPSLKYTPIYKLIASQ
jgi:hypothetical protein